jgi:hypothetical protein
LKAPRGLDSATTLSVNFCPADSTDQRNTF